MGKGFDKGHAILHSEIMADLSTYRAGADLLVNLAMHEQAYGDVVAHFALTKGFAPGAALTEVEKKQVTDMMIIAAQKAVDSAVKSTGYSFREDDFNGMVAALKRAAPLPQREPNREGGRCGL